jgi:hypothetical protein
VTTSVVTLVDAMVVSAEATAATAIETAAVLYVADFAKNAISDLGALESAVVAAAIIAAAGAAVVTALLLWLFLLRLLQRLLLQLLVSCYGVLCSRFC